MKDSYAAFMEWESMIIRNTRISISQAHITLSSESESSFLINIFMLDIVSL